LPDDGPAFPTMIYVHSLAVRPNTIPNGPR
jgi:hypothetical protein